MQTKKALEMCLNWDLFIIHISVYYYRCSVIGKYTSCFFFFRNHNGSKAQKQTPHTDQIAQCKELWVVCINQSTSYVYRCFVGVYVVMYVSIQFNLNKLN